MACIGTIGIKPVTLVLQVRCGISQQLLLRVQLVQIVLSANGHGIVRSTKSRISSLYAVSGFLHDTAPIARRRSLHRRAFVNIVMMSWTQPDPLMACAAATTIGPNRRANLSRVHSLKEAASETAPIGAPLPSTTAAATASSPISTCSTATA